MRRLALLLPVILLASVFSPVHAAVVKIVDVQFPVSDGVRIIGDVYLPGPAADGPYPCVVEHTPYRKENRANEGASLLPARGIALIELDARGSAGSPGEYDVVFSIREQRDVAEVIEMVATTGIPGVGDVCLEKVGMYGGSYSGIIQYLVATLPAPWYPSHLAAIAPQRAYGDLYRDIVYHGGIVIGSFGLIWSGGTTAYYTQPPTDLATNPERALPAWLDHVTKNDPMMVNYLANQYADASWSSDDAATPWTQKLYEDSSALPRIEELKVPALHLSGWFDAFTRGQTLMFQEALKIQKPEAPNYMIVGPWNHSNTHFITPKARADFHDILAGWYLHWLRGDPAPEFMNGPALQYYLMGSGALLDTTGSWRETTAWPIPEAIPTRVYLRGGGGLSTEAPAATDAESASYVWNPAAGTGEILGRWDNTAGLPVPQPAWDQRTDSFKGLSYSTPPLTEPMRVAGPINLHLVASTQGLNLPQPILPDGFGQLAPSYHDTDFVVKLSDVAPDGTATLITSGYLRASHRAYDESRSELTDDGDVLRPFHWHDKLHLSPPGSGPNTYEIEILPTAKTFEERHRLQLDIYSADTPNHLTLLKPAMNTVFTAPGMESWLLLPLLPA